MLVVAFSLMEHGLSGGDVRLRAMLRRWADRADIVVCTSPAGRRQVQTWGLPLSCLPSRGFPESLRAGHDLAALLGSFWFAAAWRPSRIVSAPDWVYVQSDFLFEVWTGVRLKRRFPESRLVVLSHHSYREIARMSPCLKYGLLNRLQRRSFRMAARHADRVTVLPTQTGDLARQDLAAMGMPPERIGRMWNGIDLKVIESVEQPEKDFDACVIGLRRNKGLDDLAGIWAGVCRVRPSARLLVLGNMSARDRDAVKRALRRERIEKQVVFGGHRDAPALYREIKRAKICLAPTHQEPYGIAICEAMACGAPVAGYDLENYRRLHPGILTTVPCYDAGALAGAVVKLLEDRAERDRRREAGLRHVRAFDNDGLAEAEWMELVDLTARRVGSRS